ncbi:MAG: TetR/AcrR family transcriptional regulator [Thermodesulfobacteriota bacterium]
MPTALEKARQDPESMKAKILCAARKLFGEYGFHGVTTRMIAREVGIDISTLHYHWGDKTDLYEAVITDINEALGEKLVEIERRVRGKSLAVRLEVAIEVMCDYLFDQPEAANLMLLSYFTKNRTEVILDTGMTDHIANIAAAMRLVPSKAEMTPYAHARVLALWNSAINFASGEKLFRRMMGADRDTYIAVTKETLKFIMIPAFTRDREKNFSHKN